MQAFYGCANLKELNLPNTIEKIDLGAFENSGLMELHSKATTPPIINKIGYRGKVVVPHRSLRFIQRSGRVERLVRLE